MRNKILIVDDDILILDVYKFMLEKSNYDVTICNDSTDAINIALKNNFDLIITDYNMPQINGLELAKIIKKMESSIEFIMISGFLSKDVIDKAKSIGIDSIVEKPFGVQEILALINDKLGN